MRYALVGLAAWVGVGFLGGSVWADSTLTTTQAQSQVVGRPFPGLKLTNQHDAPVGLPGDAEVIIFANAKDVDEWANPLLAEFGQKQMDVHHIVYLSDIHRMPWLISKMIALPKLRERAYSVALIREADEVPASIEPTEGCLNWLQLSSGKVTAMTPICTPAELKNRLDALIAH